MCTLIFLVMVACNARYSTRPCRYPACCYPAPYGCYPAPKVRYPGPKPRYHCPKARYLAPKVLYPAPKVRYPTPADVLLSCKVRSSCNFTCCNA